MLDAEAGPQVSARGGSGFEKAIAIACDREALLAPGDTESSDGLKVPAQRRVRASCSYR